MANAKGAKPMNLPNYDWSNGMIFICSMFDPKNGATLIAKPLSNQKFSDGDPVDSAWQVVCDVQHLNKFPAGTIFATPEIEIDIDRYTADPFKPFPLADVDYNYLTSEDQLDPALKAEFDVYKKEVGKSTTVKTPRKPKTQLQKLQEDPVWAMPTVEKEGFYVDPDQWWDIALNLYFFENTLLLGPTGCGKTDILEIAANKLGRKLVTKDMGTMYDPQAAMLGQKVMSSVTGKDGNVTSVTRFDYSAYSQQIQMENVIINLDELSRALPTAANLLLPQLDHRRMLPVEIADSEHDREIKVHKTATFFATANVGGEYVGTMEMDAALVDRFNIIEFDYMPKDIEVKVLQKKTGIDSREAYNIVAFANDIRTMCKNEELSKAISTRHTLKIANKVVRGFSVQTALHSVVVPTFKGMERTVIMSNIQKY
jgi:nitric oxide reductase NorQ protein